MDLTTLIVIGIGSLLVGDKFLGWFRAPSAPGVVAQTTRPILDALLSKAGDSLPGLLGTAVKVFLAGLEAQKQAAVAK